MGRGLAEWLQIQVALNVDQRARKQRSMTSLAPIAQGYCNKALERLFWWGGGYQMSIVHPARGVRIPSFTSFWECISVQQAWQLTFHIMNALILSQDLQGP